MKLFAQNGCRKTETEKHDKLKSVPEDNRAKIEECNDLREKLERTAEEEQKKYDDAWANVQEETKVYQDEKEKLETELIGLRKDVNEKESALRIAQSKLAIIESNEQKEKARLEQMEVSQCIVGRRSSVR